LSENLELGEVEFGSAEKCLLKLKKEFDRGDEELVKVAELKNIEKGERIMQEFVQEFRKVARESEYKERVLVEEFKRKMNGIIRRNLMEVEGPPTSIEQ